jgi:hypothetical protein
MKRVRPEDPAAFREGCLNMARSLLASYRSPQEVAEAADELNAYPRLAELRPPRSIRLLEPEPTLGALGRQALLEGRILWEHPAAGEATRLGLGPKFFLKPQDLAAIMGQTQEWSQLLPLSLGPRHLLALALEISQLARESGLDPQAVLAKQVFLIIGAEEWLDAMSAQVRAVLSKFLPLKNLWFMAQTAFHGLTRSSGGDWFFDPNSPKLLYNHGHMAMQKTMDGQVFTFGESGERIYFSREEFFARVGEFSDLISSNIEDLDYLNQAIEPYSLGLATSLGSSGFGMMMEISLNNRQHPIKGGMCAFDPTLDHDVVIESFSLRDVQPKEIIYLNKNINHYLNPALVMAKLRENGLETPVAVRGDWVYFQPIQGDINFLVPTAFFTRAQDKELNSLKTISDIPAALTAMAVQDTKPGFRELAASALGR